MRDDTKLAIVVITASIGLPLLIIGSLIATDVLSLQVNLVLQAVLLISTLPFIALSAYMMVTGRGSFLVAGYNTASAAKRATYDEEAMTKSVGLIMFLTFLLVLIAIEAALLFGNTTIMWALIALSICVIIVGLVHVNLSPKIRRPAVDLVETPEEKRRMRRVIVAVAVISVVVLGVVMLAVGAGSVSVDLGDDSLTVKAPLFNDTVAYEDIENVDLISELDAGQRVFGFGGTNIKSGTFKNADYGEYRLAVYNGVGPYIVVTHSGGEVLVFNQSDAAATELLHDQLVLQISG